MSFPDPEPMMDALRAAQGRGLLPTSLGTAELRELGAGVLGRSVFAARATSVRFVAKIAEVAEAVAAGTMDDATGRVTLLETLRALGYDPESGFPDAPGEVAPALRGTLQDLSSFRRLDLIARTQADLMRGAGQQVRGHGRIEVAPAWELVRELQVEVPRDWPARWVVAGGSLIEGRMIALKGDPIWGELGSSGNFDDALDVDHPPFAFNSGMGWAEVSREVVERLGVRGPGDEGVDEWFSEERVTILGRTPKLGRPRMKLDVDPAEREELVAALEEEMGPVNEDGSLDFSDLFDAAMKEHVAGLHGGGDAGGAQ
jgi:hypothetical protein